MATSEGNERAFPFEPRFEGNTEALDGLNKLRGVRDRGLAQQMYELYWASELYERYNGGRKALDEDKVDAELSVSWERCWERVREEYLQRIRSKFGRDAYQCEIDNHTSRMQRLLTARLGRWRVRESWLEKHYPELDKRKEKAEQIGGLGFPRAGWRVLWDNVRSDGAAL